MFIQDPSKTINETAFIVIVSSGVNVNAVVVDFLYINRLLTATVHIQNNLNRMGQDLTWAVSVFVNIIV